jgi:hypothetical protein
MCNVLLHDPLWAKFCAVPSLLAPDQRASETDYIHASYATIRIMARTRGGKTYVEDCGANARA